MSSKIGYHIIKSVASYLDYRELTYLNSLTSYVFEEGGINLDKIKHETIWMCTYWIDRQTNRPSYAVIYPDGKKKEMMSIIQRKRRSDLFIPLGMSFDSTRVGKEYSVQIGSQIDLFAYLGKLIKTYYTFRNGHYHLHTFSSTFHYSLPTWVIYP